MAAAVGMNPGTVFDLAAGWGLNDEAARDSAVKKIMDEKPEFLILSPRCTAVSTLAALSDRDGPHYKKVLKERMIHLGFVVRLIWVQIQAGRYSTFEHHWSAWSWYLDALREIMQQPGVILARGDQCHSGHQTIDGAGKPGPVMKRS